MRLVRSPIRVGSSRAAALLAMLFQAGGATESSTERFGYALPELHFKISAMVKFHRAVPVQELRLLVFDLDGTLIDSRRDLANCINAMLRHLQRPELPEDIIGSYVGDGAPMLVRRALGDPDDDALFHSGLEFFLDYYREHKLDHTHLYAGIAEALAAIGDSQNGAAGGRRILTILTNKPVIPARAIVQALGIQQFFAQVYGGNSFPTKKPDPLGIRTLMREFQAAPRQTLVIGDSDIDTLTGHNAGAWTCGVRYGFDPSRLDKAPPDICIDQPGELPLIFAPDCQTVLDAESIRDIVP
jgi:phosphoglycolate phosphatase